MHLVPASAHRRWHGMEVRSDALTHQRAISGGVRLADVPATERTLCYESTPLRIHAATDPRRYGPTLLRIQVAAGALGAI